jgi:hypothetical protein
MRFLRTISTQRLLATLAGLVIAIAGGTAIALGAASGGPVPPRESLAKALHQAASAPAVSGITARIKFTNNLISSSDLQGTDPILSGATGRLWLSTTSHRLRLELQGNNGDAQVVFDNGSFSIYDPMSNTVYKGTLPQPGPGNSSTDKSKTEPIPSVAQIQRDLNQLMQHLNVVGPLPRNVAGQPAYKVVISPKHDGGLLGQLQLAWDAARGVPLGIAIYSNTSSTPVLELKATSISYGRVPSSDLSIQAPAGAKVVQISQTISQTAGAADRSHGSTVVPALKGTRGQGMHGKHGGKSGKGNSEVTGPAAVQAHLPFTLAAPTRLDGLARQSVELLDWGGSPAALVTYGQGLGGIVVIEQSAPSSSQQQQPSQSQTQDGQPGLSLPTVSINGATGQELATALGTVIRVSRGAVEYTVLGSVPPIAAETAAKQLVP